MKGVTKIYNLADFEYSFYFDRGIVKLVRTHSEQYVHYNQFKQDFCSTGFLM